MSEHRAALAWKRETPEFNYDSYDRGHRLSFGGGTSILASSAPQYLGKAEFPNPEELLAASASSCHFLTFLAIAAKSRFVVDEYRDEAVALLEKNEEGRDAIRSITLRPSVRFGGEKQPSPEKIREMHDKAHHLCFVANALACEMRVEPQS